MLEPDDERTDENTERLRQLGLAGGEERGEDGPPCPDCRGERLNRVSRAVKLHFRGKREPLSLPALLAGPPEELIANLEALDLDGPGPNRFTEWDLAHFEADRVDESANGSFYDGAWALQYLRSFAGTIAGGTSEIQRNIVAERVLGLPRG